MLLIKAEAVVDKMNAELKGVHCEVVASVEEGCARADIIVSITGSHEPVVRGDWVRPGTHTDFIGNHHATKRECDTALVLKSKVYVDSYVNAFKEAGELLVPMAEGVFKKEDVIGELKEMCKATVPLRQSAQEITRFKSIGMAYSDLVGAGMAYSASSR